MRSGRRLARQVLREGNDRALHREEDEPDADGGDGEAAIVEADDEQAEGERAERLSSGVRTPSGRSLLVAPGVSAFVRWSWDGDVTDLDRFGPRSNVGRQQRERDL